MCAIGTYYGIGMTTFEPTIGVTSLDNLYMTSWGNGTGWIDRDSQVLRSDWYVEFERLLL